MNQIQFNANYPWLALLSPSYSYNTILDETGQAQVVSPTNPLPTTATINAGSALIGKVSIDQTTQFTTNAVTIVGLITKTDKSGTIASGFTSQQLMSANPNRRGWQLQNNSNAIIAFNEVGNAASLTAGSFILQPGAAYESPVGAISTAQINIVGVTSGQAFTAREW